MIISGNASSNCLLQGGTVWVTAKGNRFFVEAVFYRYRESIPWRDLPKSYGDFRVIHTRHMRLDKRGVWQQIFKVPAAKNSAFAKKVTPPKNLPVSPTEI